MVGSHTQLLHLCLGDRLSKNQHLHGPFAIFLPDRDAGDAGGSVERRGFVLPGFESADATRKVAAAPHAGHAFTDDGTHASLTVIEQVFFLVPIYIGAGSERKTLETLQAGHYVLGTPAAFIGLRPSFLKARARSVASLCEIALLDAVPLDIGELLVGFLGPAAARRLR